MKGSQPQTAAGDRTALRLMVTHIDSDHVEWQWLNDLKVTTRRDAASLLARLSCRVTDLEQERLDGG